MLPMGTIVTVCMLVGLLFATRLPGFNLLQRLPLVFRQCVGAIVFLAGAWNVFWYALQHLTEYWGVAALVSGILMMVTGAYIAKAEWLPVWLRKSMPVILALLLVAALHYGWTIYNL